MNTENENENESQAAPLEIISQSALESITRAEIDVSISTARRFPRPDMSIIKKRIMSIACMDVETAESCFYSLKRKSQDGGDRAIKGPSIRLAEIAVTQYGNLKFGSRVIATDDKTITAQGVCHDLETNISCAVEVKRNITTRSGAKFGADMVTVTGNAACAIALRNAILKVVPMAMLKPIYLQCIEVAIGKGEVFIAKRARVFDRFAKMHIDAKRILTYLEKSDIEAVDADDLADLIGVGTAIKEGEIKIEDAFPPPAHPGLEPKPAQPVTGTAAPAKEPEKAPAKSADKPAESAPATATTSTAAPANVVQMPPPAESPEDKEAREEQERMAQARKDIADARARDEAAAKAKAAPAQTAPAANAPLPDPHPDMVPQMRAKLQELGISVGQMSQYMQKNYKLEAFTRLDDFFKASPKWFRNILHKHLTDPQKLANIKAMPDADVKEG